jgi:hypothetical protein
VASETPPDTQQLLYRLGELEKKPTRLEGRARSRGCLLEILGYDQATNTITSGGIIHADDYGVYDSAPQS